MFMIYCARSVSSLSVRVDDQACPVSIRRITPLTTPSVLKPKKNASSDKNILMTRHITTYRTDLHDQACGRVRVVFFLLQSLEQHYVPDAFNTRAFGY